MQSNRDQAIKEMAKIIYMEQDEVSGSVKSSMSISQALYDAGWRKVDSPPEGKG